MNPDARTPGVVYLDAPRTSQGLIAQLSVVPVASAGKSGHARLVGRSLRPNLVGRRIAGRAITCECAPEDNLALYRAIELCAEGDVVIAAQPNGETALWGGLMSRAARARGAIAAVIDGFTRDVAELRDLQFPIWSRGVCAVGPKHEQLTSVNAPIVCGGTRVCPGDIVIADDDGVAVVALEDAGRLVEAVQRLVESELAIGERLDAGEPLRSALRLEHPSREPVPVEIEGRWSAHSPHGDTAVGRAEAAAALLRAGVEFDDAEVDALVEAGSAYMQSVRELWQADVESTEPAITFRLDS